MAGQSSYDNKHSKSTNHQNQEVTNTLQAERGKKSFSQSQRIKICTSKVFTGLSPSITSLHTGSISKGGLDSDRSRTHTTGTAWHSTVLPKHKGNEKDAWQTGVQE